LSLPALSVRTRRMKRSSPLEDGRAMRWNTQSSHQPKDTFHG
jgi:hypothetical protein